MVGMAWAFLIFRFVLAGAFPRTRKLIKKLKRSKK